MKFNVLWTFVLFLVVMVACKVFDFDPAYILVYWWMGKIIADAVNEEKAMKDASKKEQERKP